MEKTPTKEEMIEEMIEQDINDIFQAGLKDTAYLYDVLSGNHDNKPFSQFTDKEIIDEWLNRGLGDDYMDEEEEFEEICEQLLKVWNKDKNNTMIVAREKIIDALVELDIKLIEKCYTIGDREYLDSVLRGEDFTPYSTLSDEKLNELYMQNIDKIEGNQLEAPPSEINIDLTAIEEKHNENGTMFRADIVFGDGTKVSVPFFADNTYDIDDLMEGCNEESSENRDALWEIFERQLWGDNLASLTFKVDNESQNQNDDQKLMQSIFDKNRLARERKNTTIESENKKPV